MNASKAARPFPLPVDEAGQFRQSGNDMPPAALRTLHRNIPAKPCRSCPCPAPTAQAEGTAACRVSCPARPPGLPRAGPGTTRQRRLVQTGDMTRTWRRAPARPPFLSRAEPARSASPPRHRFDGFRDRHGGGPARRMPTTRRRCWPASTSTRATPPAGCPSTATPPDNRADRRARRRGLRAVLGAHAARLLRVPAPWHAQRADPRREPRPGAALPGHRAARPGGGSTGPAGSRGARRSPRPVPSPPRRRAGPGVRLRVAAAPAPQPVVLARWGGLGAGLGGFPLSRAGHADDYALGAPLQRSAFIGGPPRFTPPCSTCRPPRRGRPRQLPRRRAGAASACSTGATAPPSPGLRPTATRCRPACPRTRSPASSTCRRDAAPPVGEEGPRASASSRRPCAATWPVALTKTGHSIARVAADLGYADTSAFYRAFTGWTGMSPERYRRQLAGGPPPDSPGLRR